MIKRVSNMQKAVASDILPLNCDSREKRLRFMNVYFSVLTLVTFVSLSIRML